MRTLNPLPIACRKEHPVLFRLVCVRVVNAGPPSVAAQTCCCFLIPFVSDSAEDGLKQLGEDAALSQPEDLRNSMQAAGAAAGRLGASMLAGATVALPMLLPAPCPPLPTKVGRWLAGISQRVLGSRWRVVLGNRLCFPQVLTGNIC